LFEGQRSLVILLGGGSLPRFLTALHLQRAQNSQPARTIPARNIQLVGGIPVQNLQSVGMFQCNNFSQQEYS
jgi:hypothetical protein